MPDPETATIERFRRKREEILAAAREVFTREGWLWQDNATTDYQHFDTGYPSRPL